MALSAAHERFAQLVAKGESQAVAYRQAVNKNVGDETAWVNGSKLAAKVALRVEELRAAAKERANAKYVYEYEDAMREIDEALVLARDKDDPKAMTAAIALKAKLSGLETEARKNERPPFEGMTDEELVAGINRDLDEAGFTLQ